MPPARPAKPSERAPITSVLANQRQCKRRKAWRPPNERRPRQRLLLQRNVAQARTCSWVAVIHATSCHQQHFAP